MTATQMRTQSDVATIERDALRRRAQERLVRFDDMRAASRLRQLGKSQREIAEALQTTQPRVHRMLKAVDMRGGTEPTAEELILRATVDQTDRAEMVEQLTNLICTFTEYAPEPFEGSAPGTWTDVEVALMSGLLSQGEYDRVRDAVHTPVHA